MKRRILIILILSMIFVSGCWDMVEINQRLFVSSIGVDLNKERGMNKYIVTYVYPNINAIGKNASEKTKKFVVTTPCSSIFQAGREFSTSVEFPFYYKHLKVLVIGEDLAKEEKLLRQTLDALNRDTKINKKVQILVAEGTAKDILKGKPEHEQITDGTIYNILKDNKSASRFTPQTLTGVIKDSDFCCVTVVPRIIKKEKEFEISGGAILKNYKLIGWIGQKENRALALMRNKVKTELIDIPYRDTIISYTVTNTNSSKEVIIDEEINVDLKINLEGYLQEYIIEEGKTVYNDEVLRDMERAIEKGVKKEIEDTIKLLQNEYNADVIGVGEHLSKFNSKAWAQIKGNWVKMFPDVKFNVTVDAKIRRTGLTK